MTLKTPDSHSLEGMLLTLPIPEELKHKARSGTLTSYDLRLLYRLLKRTQGHHPLFDQFMAMLHTRAAELEGSMGLDVLMASFALEQELEPSR